MEFCGGKCWICGQEDERYDNEWLFDWDWDTWVHQSCLDKTGCKSITEYESLGNEND